MARKDFMQAKQFFYYCAIHVGQLFRRQDCLGGLWGKQHVIHVGRFFGKKPKSREKNLLENKYPVDF
ncbi:MAG: hypothetical protein HYZ15_13990 [Sphingobacteriales bacterium]|nr:hypothetical protein [Sphingobacteriales bacterium]